MSSASSASSPPPEGPATAPEPHELPVDEQTLAPAGRLRGDAGELLLAIARARITPSAKDVLLVLFAATYAPSNTTGWVRVTHRSLAAYFETWPNDISERLNELLGCGIIHRPGRRMVICLCPVRNWDPAVFDFERAHKKHAKRGAGTPPVVREPTPHIPLPERIGDIRDRDFLTRDLVELHVRERGGDDTAVAAHWAVVERFQSITDQAFRATFLGQLTEQLATHTSTAIIVELTRIQRRYAPPNPWGYVLRCFQNSPKPKEDPTHDHQFTSPGQERRRGAALRPSGDDADAGNPGIASRILDLSAYSPGASDADAQATAERLLIDTRHSDRG